METHKGFVAIAALLGASSVGLAAFGAHGLRQYVDESAVNSYNTAVQFQMYHTLALLAVGVLYSSGHKELLKYAGVAFLLGILFFSGGIYVVTLGRAIHSSLLMKAGIITPFWGFCFIIGWLLLFLGILKKNK